MASGDASLKQAILSRIRSVAVAIDFDDLINDDLVNYAQKYVMHLDKDAGLLRVTVNAKAVDNTLTNFHQKIEILLNVRIEQEIVKANTALKHVEEKFKSQTGISVPIEIDFAFTKHPIFIDEGQKKSYEKLERYSRIISHLHRTAVPSFLLTSNDS